MHVNWNIPKLRSRECFVQFLLREGANFPLVNILHQVYSHVKRKEEMDDDCKISKRVDETKGRLSPLVRTSMFKYISKDLNEV